MKLTKANLPRLQKDAAGRADFLAFDDDLAGFGVRIRAGGKRTWIVQYRFAGKQRRLSLGSVDVLDPDEARKRARKALGTVAHGSDPRRSKTPP